MTDSPPPLLRPLPRRPFELSPLISSEASDSPVESEPDPSSPEERRDSQGNLTNGLKSESFAASRSRSLLNLTSSTLFGIYAPTQSHDAGSAYPSEPATPWGTGAETPARRSVDDGRPQWLEIKGSAQKEAEGHSGVRSRREGVGIKRNPSLLATTGRTIILFLLGVGYGTLVSHLHDSQHIAPVYISNINRSSWWYTLFWGVAAVLLGSLLPYLDSLWRNNPHSTSDAPNSSSRKSSSKSSDAKKPSSGRPSADDWSLAVRSIGAFVGIAFAIRKLPWQSTLQVSATLALANPALWYLLDRTKPGFLLSAFVGTLGTVALLLLNPSIVPEPGAAAASGPAANATAIPEGWAAVGRQWLQSFGAGSGAGQPTWAPQQAVEPTLLGGMLSYESVGVATWLGSVLFCSSICFGNVGRKMGI